ncbi:MAG: cation transporter, partial [Sphingobacteriales bacterium]
MAEHNHNHAHKLDAKSLNKAFVAGIFINLAFVFVEAIVGFFSNSLALLSDAGHNLSDVASLALSLFALKISQRKATKIFTYGFSKSTILASLLNAVI